MPLVTLISNDITDTSPKFNLAVILEVAPIFCPILKNRSIDL